MINFYVGYDPKYPQVNQVCKYSLNKYNIECFDVPSLIEDNTTNTFCRSRFMVPYLDKGKSDWVFFCDDDFIFLEDPTSILDNIVYDSEKVIYVCMHSDYKSKVKYKMDGNKQINYKRKNWASLILFNKKNYTLSLDDIMTKPLNFLLQFDWLHDCQIGSIPLEWNWLVGEYEEYVKVKALHFTLGGPWYKNPHKSNYNLTWNNFKRNYYENIERTK